TPVERRQAEAMLCGIGLRSVPVAVAVLRDASASYPARSIAARALAWTAFPQLESLSPALIRTELQQAYQCLYIHHVLEGGDSRACSGEPCGRVVLSRYYRGQPAVIVDFVLELLTLGGRLPHFERISAALRFGSRKERGDAFETIEQGVCREH